MIAREVPVQDVLRVVLQSGTQNLEEVVVTAIGMKKQEKALGYAAMVSFVLREWIVIT